MSSSKGQPAESSRLIARAMRHPRRALALARRAYGHTAGSATSAEAWAAYTLAQVLIIGENYSEAIALVSAGRAIFTGLGCSTALLYCRFAELRLNAMGGGNPALQAEWEQLFAAFIAGGQIGASMHARFEQIAQTYLLGRPDEALAMVNQLSSMVYAYGGGNELARLHRLHGGILANLGALDGALSEYAAAEALYRELRQRPDLARVWLARAWVYQRRERYDLALIDMEQAAATFRYFGLAASAAICLRDLGRAAGQTGRLGQALATTLEAHQMFSAIQRPAMAAICDLNLGQIAYYSGRYELALAAYQRAQSILIALDMRRDLLICRRYQAMALQAIGKPVAALASLDALEETAGALGEELERAAAIQARGRVLIDLGNLVDARRDLERARALFARARNFPAAAECDVDLGWAMINAGTPAEAWRRLAVTTIDLVDRPFHLWRAEYGLGRCAQLLGDEAAAFACYCEAAATIARLRHGLVNEHFSSGIFDQARQLFNETFAMAAERNEPLTILQLASQQQALALKLQIAGAAVALPPRLRPRYEECRTELNRLIATDAEPAALDAALNRYVESLLARQHNLPDADLPEPAATIDLTTLRQGFNAAYPAGWTVLCYVFTNHELLIVTLDDQELVLHRTPCDETLHNTLQLAGNSSLEQRHATFLDLPYHRGQVMQPWASLEFLGERLIPPAVRAKLHRLHPDQRLLIVPSGQLHGLPWAALRLTGRWLCERAIVQCLPSLTLWPDLHARQRPGHAALLLGCAHFNGRAPELPGALASLDLAAACWPGPLSRMENVTRAALLEKAAQGELARYGLIHIASHGQIDEEQGMLTHLKLSDDDLLYDEISQLRLQGATVMLAACDGALGEALPGEDVLGLSRAFLAAGAREVVASLWPVYDKTVPFLLEPFYRGLAGGLDAAAALAYAQRLLINYPVDEQGEGMINLLPRPLAWAGWCALGACSG